MWSYYSAKPLIIRFNNVPLFAEMLFLTTCQYMLLLNLNIENVIISGYYSQKSGDSSRLLEICRFQLYFWYFLRVNIITNFFHFFMKLFCCILFEIIFQFVTHNITCYQFCWWRRSPTKCAFWDRVLKT